MFQIEVADKIKHTFYVEKKIILANRAVYSIMYNNMLEPWRPQII